MALSFLLDRCVIPLKLANFIETMQYLPWAGFSALRAYALSRNRPISVVVFVLSIVPIAVNLVDEFAFEKPAVLPSTSSSCTMDGTASPQVIIGFTIASRVSLIAADAILIVITWMKLSRRRDGDGGSFVHVLLRDGTLYFICLLVLNTLHLSFTIASVSDGPSSLLTDIPRVEPDAQLVTLYQIATPTGRQDSNVITFSEPLTAVLITRFMLNLQAVNRKALHLGGPAAATSSSGSCGGSLVFERVVGSLGASVLDDRELEEENGDEDKDQ
ncbi:hypothetical protein OH76DRAFT_1010153 [Lentinus brumalis]|uniref:Uncharacterized protein n=1 Tax=Lentinus brumalis TaxID=2498619 RepID=A0A371CYB9_9APHY|nr:hypothetical protein OH76DRAFT_1010153 [Polyporus brumalis]